MDPEILQCANTQLFSRPSLLIQILENPQNQLCWPRHCVHLTVNISNLSVDWKFSRRDETEIEFSIKSPGSGRAPQ